MSDLFAALERIYYETIGLFRVKCKKVVYKGFAEKNSCGFEAIWRLHPSAAPTPADLHHIITCPKLDQHLSMLEVI